MWTSAYLLLVAAVGNLAAAANAPVPLWPSGAPGEPESSVEESDLTKPTDNLVGGRRLIRLGNVSRPTLTVYRAPKARETGATILVFPGGGYQILALDLEGSEVCEWLNSIGVNAVLVKYRVPSRKGDPRYRAPLQDAQRAMGLVRSHAGEWGLDPKRIGVIGFSAGGHLSAALSNNFGQRTYPAVDAADQVDCRPDFSMLIYPAYLVDGEAVAPELPITAHTPPTFLIQTEDDVIKVECSLLYYLALKKAGVPAEMHLYATGGHGYGLRPAKAEVTGWPVLAEKWLRSIGVMGPANH